MIRRPPRSTRTDTLFPYTTLFRSGMADVFFFTTVHSGLPPACSCGCTSSRGVGHWKHRNWLVSDPGAAQFLRRQASADVLERAEDSRPAGCLYRYELSEGRPIRRELGRASCRERGGQDV